MSKKTWITLAAASGLLAAAPAFAQHDRDHAQPAPAAAPAAAKETKVAAKHGDVRTVEVKVTNEFSPAEIHVKKGEKVKLVFTRTTDRTCATSVHARELGVNQELPLNKPVAVTVEPKKAGKYRYSCSMNMIAGTLVVD